jgi:transcriptional regulator with XRE-family HTH domain
MTMTEFDRIRAIGRRVRRKRIADRLTLDQAAAQSRVSAPTLSRLERQALVQDDAALMMPGTGTFIRVLDWLGEWRRDAVQVDSEIGTLQAVDASLRTDPNLNPITAEMLSNLFRLIYEHYTTLSSIEGGTRDTFQPDAEPRCTRADEAS